MQSTRAGLPPTLTFMIPLQEKTCQATMSGKIEGHKQVCLGKEGAIGVLKSEW